MFVIAQNNETNEKFLIGTTKLSMFGRTFYIVDWTSIRRNNFSRMKEFKSELLAKNYIEQLNSKEIDTSDFIIIDSNKAKNLIGDSNNAYVEYKDNLEKERKERAQTRYELNKEHNKHRNADLSEINPGKYKVIFWYSTKALGCEGFYVDAESKNDAFIKAKAKALREDSNRLIMGYDLKMTFNKNYIYKLDDTNENISISEKKFIYESIMKSVAKTVKNALNEDSLDDFDINGEIAKKRNTVSTQRKQEVEKLIDKFYSIIQKCCKKILSKKYKLIESEKYLNTNSYRINYPDLLWGFTYTPGQSVHFTIYIGSYGHIETETIDTKKPNDMIKELHDCIVKAFISKGYTISDRLDTWKDSLNGLMSSASFVLRINVKID